MSKEIGSSVEKVQQTLKSLGFSDEIMVFPDSTRTAIEAAQAVGCSLGQIVKSLVFKGAQSQMPVLALVSGANRVNEKRLGLLLGEKIEKLTRILCGNILVLRWVAYHRLVTLNPWQPSLIGIYCSMMKSGLLRAAPTRCFD